MAFFFLIMIESHPIGFTCKINTPNTITLDTVYLSKKILFSSDLVLLQKNCFPEFIEEEPLTKSRVISLQRRLNEELNTSNFNLLQVVTGKRIKLPSNNYFITFMEWHFDSDSLTNIIFNELSNLKDNTIKHTVVPNALRYVKEKGKIYVVTYSPFKKGVDTMDRILQCIDDN